MEKKSIYEIITEKIVNQLDKGLIPWNKPWTCSNGAVSHTSGRPYSLLNQILLMDEGEDLDSMHGREYITFNQIQAEGGSIKKGEKSKMVVFWKILLKETEELNDDGSKKVKTIPTLRYYNVWEVSQCAGITRKYEEIRIEHDPIQEAEDIVNAYFGRETCRLEVKESNTACYRPLEDIVIVPQPSQYDLIEEYYSTLFHEMTHSTGHRTRCSRNIEEVAAFGSDKYSREELVAELGSAFLMNKAGIDCDKAFKNSAAYIQGWSRKLRNEPRLFVSAAARAEAAVNYIIGKEA